VKLRSASTLPPESMGPGVVVLPGDVAEVVGAIGYAVGDVVAQATWDFGPDAPDLAGLGATLVDAEAYVLPWAYDVEVEAEVSAPAGAGVTEVTLAVTLGADMVTLVGAPGSVLASSTTAGATGTGALSVVAAGEVTGGSGIAQLDRLTVRGVPLYGLPDPT
jgi:hypothetical protein